MKQFGSVCIAFVHSKDAEMDGYTFFNSFSVLSGRWAVDNERLYRMEQCLRLKRALRQAGLVPRTARSVGQCLTTELLGLPKDADGSTNNAGPDQTAPTGAV